MSTAGRLCGRIIFGSFVLPRSHIVYSQEDWVSGQVKAAEARAAQLEEVGAQLQGRSLELCAPIPATQYRRARWKAGENVLMYRQRTY